MATNTRRPRLQVSFDDDSLALLSMLAKETELSEAGIVSRLFNSHLAELWEYQEWLEKQPPKSRTRSLGVNLLVSYGPEDLVAGIKRIDPTYRTHAERLADELAAVKSKTLEEASEPNDACEPIARSQGTAR